MSFSLFRVLSNRTKPFPMNVQLKCFVAKYNWLFYHHHKDISCVCVCASLKTSQFGQELEREEKTFEVWADWKHFIRASYRMCKLIMLHKQLVMCATLLIFISVNFLEGVTIWIKMNLLQISIMIKDSVRKTWCSCWIV